MKTRDLRVSLRDMADELVVDENLPERVIRDARRRILRGTAVGFVAACLLTASVVAVFSPPASAPRRDQPQPLALRLTGYVQDGSGVPSELTKHVECMRTKGFDLPEPVATGDGWTIHIVDPDAMGIGSAEWRRAAFVVCGLTAPHGNLLFLGKRTEQAVEKFAACMRGRGYEMPEPLFRGSRWIVDLAGSGIDTSTRRWREAFFFDCPPAGFD